MAEDGRRDERQPITLKIRFKTATLNAFIEQYSRDVSRGGIFIKMKSPMPVGTLIKFDFRLQDEKSLIQGVGRVVWRREEESTPDSPSGMGIKFIKLDETSKINLETILKAKNQDKRATGEAPVVERKSTGSRPPQPIAPLRPRVVPKSLKRTPAKADEDAAEADEEAPASTPPPAADETDDGAPAHKTATVEPQEADAAESRISKPGFMDDTDIDETFLDDITSAIDSALGQDVFEKRLAQEAAGAQAEMSIKISQETSEEKAPAREEAADKEEAREDTPTKRLSVPPQEGLERLRLSQARDPSVYGDRRRPSAALVVILIVAVAAAAIWWFLIRKQPVEVEETTRGADLPGIGTPPKPEPTAEPPAKPPVAQKAEPAVQPEKEPPKEPASTTVLEITSDPKGAKLFVNGKEHDAVAPAKVENLTPGEELEVTAKLFAYVTASQKITLKPEPNELAFELKPAKLVLDLKSDPTGAHVLVDGKWWGKTPKKSSIDHQTSPRISYAITKSGYEDLNGKTTEADWTEQEGVFTFSIEAALTKKEKEPPPQPAAKTRAWKKPAKKTEPTAEPPAEEKEPDKPAEAEPKEDKPKEDKPKLVTPKDDSPKILEPKDDKSNIEENPF